MKGVRGFSERILKVIPGFQIEIRDGRVRLVHIFRARLWTSTAAPEASIALTYEKLIKVAEDSQVETEICSA